jgi:iron complex transport system ATP-binding protein
MTESLSPPRSYPALDFSGVTVWEWDERSRARVPILREIDWQVGAGEAWAVLGPNGAGKTTMLAVAAGMRHPSLGMVRVLGAQLGRVDVRELRTHIGQVSPRLEESFPPARVALDVVLSGATGSVAVLDDRLEESDPERARRLLALFGCGDLAERPFGRCSQGERRRLLLARALMHRPPLLLLDEPSDGLDLPGREALLAALERLPCEEPETAVVLVTHHLEELPASTTHALLLRRGAVIARGRVADVLVDEPLSDCFGVSVTVSHDEGRWIGRARPSW